MAAPKVVEYDKAAFDVAIQAMKGPHVILELVRDKNGRVINVCPVAPASILPVTMESTPGFVQVVDGNVVAHFNPDEIVVAPVSYP